MWAINVIVLAAALTAVSGEKADQDSCDSDVYCRGDLLHTVQMAALFPDSKTFVDMKQQQPVIETLRVFNELMLQTSNSPTKEQVAQFVDGAFTSGGEIQEWTLPDFNPNPAFLSTIDDPALRDWASDLNHLWKNLSRKMSDDVRENQERYSIIYVPNGFVVPGGRFKEFYYWDTYWAFKGLLHCELYETARGVIDNFLYIVGEYGFIPNGGRVYYLNRSQPPLLTLMVRDYVEATGDIDFFTARALTLEREFEFWTSHRTVEVEKNGQRYTLARYFVESASPRPESYREDYLEAQELPEPLRSSFYVNMKSAAESGWDFSTRWFVKGGTNEGTLQDIKTKSIIPVDLNAFIYGVATSLSELFIMSGDSEKAVLYAEIADSWLEAVTAVLWHDDVGSWLDYDLDNRIRRNYFYPSNLAPLWTNCYNEGETAQITNKVLSYIASSGAMSYMGGLPTSLVNSRQQWDLPNAWPPLQHIVIMGLDNTQQPAAQDLAFELAKRWVHANYLGYQDSREMYEKYDAIVPGQYGGGGEYTVQAGFGWTNGVILDLLAKYGDRLMANK